MIISDLFSSKDACPVCGQTPCNCTHITESVNSIGNKIKALYQKIYNAGDDAVEFVYYDSPIFAHYWDEYEGDLDSIIAEVDPSELEIILSELESGVEDQGLAEGAAAGKVRFVLDSERAYQAVMARFGDMIDWDENEYMTVPERIWPRVQQVAYDADGIGAEDVDQGSDYENPEHYGVTEADKHSFVGKIQRHHELKKKVDQTWKDAADAEKRGDTKGADRAFNKHVRYANLERPGTWTTVKEQGVAEGSGDITAIFSGHSNYMDGRAANVFKHYGITVLDRQHSEDEDISEYTVTGSKEALDKARAYLERSDQFGGMILKQGVAEGSLEENSMADFFTKAAQEKFPTATIRKNGETIQQLPKHEVPVPAAAAPADVTKLKQQYAELEKRYNQLGGDSWQYADRMMPRDLEAQQVQQQMSSIARQIDNAKGLEEVENQKPESLTYKDLFKQPEPGQETEKPEEQHLHNWDEYWKLRNEKQPQKDVAEGDKKPEPPEADYGDEYQAMVGRLKKLAGMGPLKTVYDPKRRVYRNMPTAVQPPKK